MQFHAIDSAAPEAFPSLVIEPGKTYYVEHDHPGSGRFLALKIAGAIKGKEIAWINYHMPGNNPVTRHGITYIRSGTPDGMEKAIDNLDKNTTRVVIAPDLRDGSRVHFVGRANFAHESRHLIKLVLLMRAIAGKEGVVIITEWRGSRVPESVIPLADRYTLNGNGKKRPFELSKKTSAVN